MAVPGVVRIELAEQRRDRKARLCDWIVDHDDAFRIASGYY